MNDKFYPPHIFLFLIKSGLIFFFKFRQYLQIYGTLEYIWLSQITLLCHMNYVIEPANPPKLKQQLTARARN